MKGRKQELLIRLDDHLIIHFLLNEFRKHRQSQRIVNRSSDGCSGIKVPYYRAGERLVRDRSRDISERLKSGNDRLLNGCA